MRPACDASSSPSGGTCGRPQEGKIAAFVRPEYLLAEEPGVAALGLDARRFQRGGTLLKLGLLDQEVDTPLLDREAYAVAGANEAERAAGGRVRRDMQHNGAE